MAPLAGQAAVFSVDNGPGIDPGPWGIVDASVTVGADGPFTATYRTATLASTVDVTVWL